MSNFCKRLDFSQGLWNTFSYSSKAKTGPKIYIAKCCGSMPMDTKYDTNKIEGKKGRQSDG